MKNTIYKYFFHEFVRYFIVVLFALTAVIWTIQAVNHLDLITEDGHAFSIYFLYSFLTLSKHRLICCMEIILYLKDDFDHH